MGVKKPDLSKIENSINPFSIELQIKATSFNSKSSLLVELSDGVNIPGGEFTRTNIVEAQEYTKVYHDTWYRNLMINLSPRALQLWTYIIYDLDRNIDYYWLNTTYVHKQLNYRSIRELNTVLEDQLIRYALLAHSGTKDTYWINPRVIFNGNRLNKYPDKLLIREV